MIIEKEFKKICKTKSDINEHCKTLRNLASEFDRVTEFGVRGGVSTRAFLAGRPKRLISYDKRPAETDTFMEMAKEYGVDFQFTQKDVLEIEIQPTDLLFLDTLHTYKQLYEELRLHAGKVSSCIVIHDTETFATHDQGGSKEEGKKGLRPAINDFLNGPGSDWKIDKDYKNNNGLTILRRK